MAFAGRSASCKTMDDSPRLRWTNKEPPSPAKINYAKTSDITLCMALPPGPLNRGRTTAVKVQLLRTGAQTKWTAKSPDNYWLNRDSYAHDSRVRKRVHVVLDNKPQLENKVRQQRPGQVSHLMMQASAPSPLFPSTINRGVSLLPQDLNPAGLSTRDCEQKTWDAGGLTRPYCRVWLDDIACPIYAQI